MTCPYCHQDAPSIVRGVRAYCTVCGAPRSLATVHTAVNVAGQPAKVGGGIASVLGLAALAVGLTIALVLGAVANLIFAMGTALWVGGTVTFFTLLIALPLILGGRRLNQVGDDRARAAQEHAIFALAAQRRGVLTVREAASALSLREGEADDLLTTLAKRQDGRVTLEVDDNGGLSYLFHDLLPATASRVRVAPPPWQAPVRAPQAASAPRVIDAELIDEDEDARAREPVRHASR